MPRPDAAPEPASLTRRSLLRYGLGAAGSVMLLPHGGRAIAGPAAVRAGAVRAPVPGENGKLAMFGRMFPKLKPFAPDPDTATSLGCLTGLASAMLEPGGGFDTVNGALYTYFAQFVDHDVTLDLQAQPDAFFSFAKNTARSPLLDPTGAVVYDYESKKLNLSQIYGGGPSVSPQLYDPDGLHFLIPANVNGVIDLPRNPDGTAIIVEHRDDENQITSQLHVAMLLFHNNLVDALKIRSFTRAMRMVICYYQWAILHDFMPTMFGQATINAMLAGKHRIYDPGADATRPIMPVEFSTAGYRFGHSMVRNAYSLNPVISPSNKNARNMLFAGLGGGLGAVGGAGQPMTPVGDLHGGYPLTLDHQIDWRNFSEDLFDPAVPGASLQVFKQIGADGLHMIGQSMFQMPIGGQSGVAPSGSGSIAFRDLVRGYFYLLPSGQDVATAYGITPIPATTVIDPSAIPGFTGGTPLWFYVMYETYLQNRNSPVISDFDSTGTAGDAQQVALGPVGSRICTDVLLRLIMLDADGILAPGSQFTPAAPVAPVPGQFRISDLLRFAGVVPSGSAPAASLGRNSGPAVTTTAPATSTTAPATSTTAPATSTTAPATSTTAPATSTTAPATSTTAPATSAATAPATAAS